MGIWTRRDSWLGDRGRAIAAGVFAAGWLAAWLPVAARGQDKPAPAQEIKLPAHAADLAINKPSQFAWELFVRVNRKAPGEFQMPGSNNAVFETWIDDPANFPKHPEKDKPPQWPDKPYTREAQLRALVEASQPRFHNLRMRLKARAVATETSEPIPPPIVQALETVHRNYATFKFIRDNDLWYQEGIATHFAKAAAKATQVNLQTINQVVQQISFPVESIEVKTNWIVITEAQKSKFKWSYLQDSTDNSKVKLFGLVGMHISSKILPQWFWCTFEHVNNDERSDYIGSYDDFGVAYEDNPANPSYQPPRLALQDANGKNVTYSPGVVRSNLLKLFAEFGYEGEYLEVYKNYRLKGAQTEFTATAGTPTMLGNSITEQGFMPTSSCITCHSRAGANSLGQSAFPIAGFQPQLFPSIQTLQTSAQTPLPTAFEIVGNPVQSYNGPLDPNWYWDYPGLDPKTGAQLYLPRLKNLQLDFVWAIPFRAQPLKKKAGSTPDAQPSNPTAANGGK